MTMDLPITAATTALQNRAIAAPHLGKGANEASMRKAAVDFEAMFLSEMMAPMFAGIQTDPMFGGGHGEEVFRSIMLQDYGKSIARSGGIGLADSIYRTMIQMQEAHNK